MRDVPRFVGHKHRESERHRERDTAQTHTRTHVHLLKAHTFLGHFVSTSPKLSNLSKFPYIFTHVHLLRAHTFLVISYRRSLYTPSYRRPRLFLYAHIYSRPIYFIIDLLSTFFNDSSISKSPYIFVRLVHFPMVRTFTMERLMEQAKT